MYSLAAVRQQTYTGDRCRQRAHIRLQYIYITHTPMSVHSNNLAAQFVSPKLHWL